MIKFVLSQDVNEYIKRQSGTKYTFNPFLAGGTLEGPNGKTTNINLETVIKDQNVRTLYIPYGSVITGKESPFIPQLVGIIYGNWETIKEKQIIFVSSNLDIHPEIEPLLMLEIDEGISQEEIRRIVERSEKVLEEDIEEVVRAMKGLSATEIHNILQSNSIVKPQEVKKIKARQIKKRTNLEYEEPQISFNVIGGNENIKEYVQTLKACLNPQAERFGIKPPKGLIIVGPQGTAKSTMAKAIASELNLPYVKLQMGNFLSKYYGESESKLTTILKNINQLAPCLIHIDEMDKVLKNTNYSHEATSRLAGILMEWMAEKETYSPVIMTANYIENIDAEFRRAGRIDKIFYTWFPNKKERESIWKIHIRLTGRNPEKYQINRLIENSDYLTGAEIETAIQIALRKAFIQNRELTTQDMLEAIEEINPIYRQKQEIFERMFENLQQFTPASKEVQYV